MQARVDIQKLQYLCDRIKETADALTQVRMSVSGPPHTMSHTGPVSPYGIGYSPMVGYPVPYQGAQPVFPWPQQSIPLPSAGFGLQHSADPRLGSLYGTSVPVGYGLPTGIRHTGVEEVEKRLFEAQAGDPYRLSQTFPFAFFGRSIGFW